VRSQAAAWLSDDTIPITMAPRMIKGHQALTLAESQAGSHLRRREAALACTDDQRAADDAALLARLALRLRDTRAKGERGDTARWVAGCILGELRRRHGIEP
jgi:hypothetical protein